ncbi:MAG: response regulator [Candidatus Acidiferrum sp.]
MAKILVADDNSNIQKMVGLALKDQGIDVVAVGNGEAAVRKISDIHPDLVLADVFMPVRNGYEVCRYVKEDPALKHIPVILLVGAFDPLDEQEAQRVGADGVLKKPFVPPDPLISMVKSALARAGVALGNAPAAEKMAPATRRSTAEAVNAGTSAKLAALTLEKLPEATAVPVEEFPTLPTQVKIASGKEPLAFGSLLDTPETEEEEPILTSKPMIHLAADRKWDEEPDDVEEEKEEVEESAQGGWRPDGLDKDVEPAAVTSKGTPDWREEAFHGASPAKSSLSNRWSPAPDRPVVAGASDSQSVAVTTVETKPSDGPVPFTGDAWAAAMAAGVEEKLAAIKDSETPAPEEQSLIQGKEVLAQELSTKTSVSNESTAVEAAPPADETKLADPPNWATVPETSWEKEAKKASLLASTWDAPKVPSVDDTQDVLVYAAEPPIAPTEAHPEASSYAEEVETFNEPEEHVEPAVSETPAESAFEASEPKSWENAWEAPAAVPAETDVVEAQTEASQVEEHQAATAVAESPMTAQAIEPDMDEIVARVLDKMNPEVMQRVTREILMPVIEAIVRDEIASKKS